MKIKRASLGIIAAGIVALNLYSYFAHRQYMIQRHMSHYPYTLNISANGYSHSKLKELTEEYRKNNPGVTFSIRTWGAFPLPVYRWSVVTIASDSESSTNSNTFLKYEGSNS